MTPEQIKQVIQGGQWVSITTELRPSTNRSATGEIQPFYCSRVFTYDLIYIYNDMLFNGSKNVDGRAFDKPENRPTNLQIPLVRQQ